jgi:hypothetical protein
MEEIIDLLDGRGLLFFTEETFQSMFGFGLLVLPFHLRAWDLGEALNQRRSGAGDDAGAPRLACG